MNYRYSLHKKTHRILSSGQGGGRVAASTKVGAPDARERTRHIISSTPISLQTETNLEESAPTD